MTKKAFIMFLIAVFPALLFAQERRVKGEYTYYAPQNVSLETAMIAAIEQARVQALAEEFGTLIDETVFTTRKNEDGKSSVNMLAIGESTVKGEWLQDTSDPETHVAYLDGFLMVTARVWGLARYIESVPVDINVKVLKNGTLDRYDYHGEQFRSGDELYLSFKTPAQGYLAIYLMDEKGNAYCMLPYAADTDGMFEVKANKPYVLFSSNHSDNDVVCDEYVLTTEKELERDMLYVIYSPNAFVKANDDASDEKVMVDNEELDLPRQLSYKDFQHWLLRNRRRDRQMQVVVKPIEIIND